MKRILGTLLDIVDLDGEREREESYLDSSIRFGSDFLAQGTGSEIINWTGNEMAHC